MNTETKTPGQIAMEAHRKSLIPTRGIIAAGYEFETMPQDTQAAWDAAAQAARAPLQAELDKVKELGLKAWGAIGEISAVLGIDYRQDGAHQRVCNMLIELLAGRDAAKARIAELEKKLDAAPLPHDGFCVAEEEMDNRPRLQNQVAELEQQILHAKGVVLVTQQKLSASEKAAAALRNALLNLCVESEGIKYCPECECDIEHHDSQCIVGHALNRDAGQNYIPIVEVESMVGALERWMQKCGISVELGQALATWRKKHPKHKERPEA